MPAAVQVQQPIRVAVADGQPFVRLAVAGIIERSSGQGLVGVAGNAIELADLLEIAAPDVLIAEPRCLSATRQPVEERPSIPTLLLSDRPARELLPLFAQGAVGIISRQANEATLLAAISAAAQGQLVLDPRELVATTTTSQSLPPLTEREREVLQLVCEALPNDDIANQLCISPGTVKAHLTAIYKKLGVSNRMAAAQTAATWGLMAVAASSSAA